MAVPRCCILNPPTFSSTFYYRQLTPPMPESSTFLNPLLTLPMLYIKSSTLLTVGLSIVVSCVVGLSKMIDRWKDDFTFLNPHLTATSASFFPGSSNELQPRRLNRFSRAIRQTTRFRARMSFSGLESINQSINRRNFYSAPAPYKTWTAALNNVNI